MAGVLAGMDALVREGGWLYFDLRNWDRILRERKRFYLYNPFFDGETRVNSSRDRIPVPSSTRSQCRRYI